MHTSFNQKLLQLSAMLTNATFNLSFLQSFFSFAYFFFSLFTFLRPLSSPIGARGRQTLEKSRALVHICVTQESVEEEELGVKQGQRMREGEEARARRLSTHSKLRTIVPKRN